MAGWVFGVPRIEISCRFQSITDCPDPGVSARPAAGAALLDVVVSAATATAATTAAAPPMVTIVLVVVRIPGFPANRVARAGRAPSGRVPTSTGCGSGSFIASPARPCKPGSALHARLGPACNYYAY
ncbi:hypothetical protein GCM10009609_45990 [Pseudonocardia aurantiaca]